MTDVDTDFVRTLTLNLADDVDTRASSAGVSKTEAFYEVLDDRGIVAAFRDTDFSKSLVKVMSTEWGVERDDAEVGVLKSLMKENGLHDTEQIGNAASAISRLRRLVLANTGAS